MPVLPTIQRQPPVLLGSEQFGQRFTVKNTFIEAEDDLAAETPISHQRRFTCPGPEKREEAYEVDTTPSDVASPGSEDSSSCRDRTFPNQGGQPCFFYQANNDGFSVKNTFIQGPGDYTPAAAHRRHVTCPPEPVPEDSPSEDDRFAAEAASSAWSDAIGASPTGKKRLSNRRLMPGGSPSMRQTRCAVATEDLQDELAEHGLSFFAGMGPSPLADASPAARTRTRANQATEDLREVLFAMKAKNQEPSEQPSLMLPTPLPATDASPPAFHARDCTRPPCQQLPPQQAPASPTSPQQCPPGYMPVATAAAAVAAVAQTAAVAAWSNPYPYGFPVSAFPQQMALAASMTAGGWPWPLCPPVPPMAPPPFLPMAQIPSPPGSAHNSPVAAVDAAAVAAMGFAMGSADSPASQPPFPVGLQASGSQNQRQAQAASVAGEDRRFVMPEPEVCDQTDEMLDGGRAKARGPRRLRLWAHIYLHMQLDGFDLVPRLIGRGGCNMRKIAEATGSKVRIRGRGSGHLEIDGKAEAPTPLMVAVTTDRADPAMFKKAIEMTMRELKTVEGRFHAFCQKQGHEHDGPCYSLGLLQPNAIQALGPLIDAIPQSNIAKVHKVGAATPGPME